MTILKKTNQILVIASSNEGKFREYNQLLSKLPVDLIRQPEGIEVEETGKTFAENARIKAFFVANLTGKWVLADDSGLCVDALDGAPGVYSARYAKNDSERIKRLFNI